eukprot:scaffold58262_cov21-Phaeocystis_antarctica.AAC.1
MFAAVQRLKRAGDAGGREGTGGGISHYCPAPDCPRTRQVALPCTNLSVGAECDLLRRGRQRRGRRGRRQ